MSYHSSNNFFNSDEESNSLFNQSFLNINSFFLTSNYPFNLLVDNESPNENEKQYSIPNKNNEESSSLNEKSNNSISKDKPELNEKDKEQNVVINIDNKTSEPKEKGKYKKVNNKVVFNIDDSFSTIHQTQNKKSKKVKTSAKGRPKNGKKDNGKESKHNKFSDDNIRRKCKFIVLTYLKDFINKKIEEKYDNIGYGINIKKLMSINKEQVSNANIDYNKHFLKKSLAKIFSEPISSRYTNYPKNKNENLIEELVNQKDKEKREYFQVLFSLNFLDCVNHFIGNEKIEKFFI